MLAVDEHLRYRRRARDCTYRRLAEVAVQHQFLELDTGIVQHTLLATAVDEIAERIRTLDVAASGT